MNKPRKGHHKRLALGVKAAFLKERRIEQCLNCKKPECNGCPKDEEEK